MSFLKRLELIKQIASELQGRYSTSDINSLFAQLGIEATEQIVSSKRVYAQESLNKADNQTLKILADDLGLSYVNFEDESSTPKVNEEDLGFWGQGNFRIFISHLSKQKDWANEVKVKFADYGIAGFVAHEDIEPTHQWQDTIEMALNSMDALVALVAEDFSSSKWTDQEVGWALGRGVPIISVNTGSNPHGFMGKYQAIPRRRSSSDELAGEIYDLFSKNDVVGEKIQATYSEVVIKIFVNSESYNQANHNMGLLEKITYLTPEMKAELLEAVETNGELADAFEVQARFEPFIQKFSD